MSTERDLLRETRLPLLDIANRYIEDTWNEDAARIHDLVRRIDAALAQPEPEPEPVAKIVRIYANHQYPPELKWNIDRIPPVGTSLYGGPPAQAVPDVNAALEAAALIVEREAFPSEAARFGVAADAIRDLKAQCWIGRCAAKPSDK